MGLQVYPPQGAPSCWGQKYQDGDAECGQCRFNDTCRKEVINNVVNGRPVVPMPGQMPGQAYPPRQMGAPTYPVPPPAPPQPVYRPVPPPPAPAMAPMPQHSFAYAPPQPVYQQPSPPQPVYQQPMYQHPQMDLSLPVRPFIVQQGETTLQRFGKNVLLSMLAVLGRELLYFFMHWTWPSKPGNNIQG